MFACIFVGKDLASWYAHRRQEILRHGGQAWLKDSQESGESITSRGNVYFTAAVFDAGLDSSDASMAEEQEEDASMPDTPEAMVKKEIEDFQIMKEEPDGACASAIDVLNVMVG